MSTIWDPLELAAVQEILRKAEFDWWIAGGFAVELFVGRSFRSHEDLDLFMLHRDHLKIRKHFPGWEIWEARQGKLSLWHENEALDASCHTLWLREKGTSSWKLEIMLDESHEEEWVSRRCKKVRLPLSELKPQSHVLPAMIQLYYKAKNPRPKDRKDWEMAWPLLSEEEKTWLKWAITTAYGDRNFWGLVPEN